VTSLIARWMSYSRTLFESRSMAASRDGRELRNEALSDDAYAWLGIFQIVTIVHQFTYGGIRNGHLSITHASYQILAAGLFQFRSGDSVLHCSFQAAHRQPSRLRIVVGVGNGMDIVVNPLVEKGAGG
jgi:hypothetical protein